MNQYNCHFEDIRMIIEQLICLAKDIVSEYGKIIKIFNYQNVLEEVPKSYVYRPTIFESLFLGKKQETISYEGFEVTKIRMFYRLPDEDGEYMEGRGQINSLKHIPILADVAFGFEQCAQYQGLLSEITPYEEIKVRTEPDFNKKT